MINTNVRTDNSAVIESMQKTIDELRKDIAYANQQTLFYMTKLAECELQIYAMQGKDIKVDRELRLIRCFRKDGMFVR